MNLLMKCLMFVEIMSVFFSGLADAPPTGLLDKLSIVAEQTYQIRGDENSLFPQDWHFADLRPGGTVTLLYNDGKVAGLRGDGTLIWGGKVIFLHNENGDYIVIDGGFKLVMQLAFKPEASNPVKAILANFEAVNSMQKKISQLQIINCTKISNQQYLLKVDLTNEHFFDTTLGVGAATTAELMIDGKNSIITGWVIRSANNQPLLSQNLGNWQFQELSAAADLFVPPPEFKVVEVDDSDELYDCFKNKGLSSWERAKISIKKQWNEFNFSGIIDHIFANMLLVCIGLLIFSAITILLALMLKKRRVAKNGIHI